MLQVEREALLVPIDAEKVSALAVDEWRTPGAGVVAFPRLLHLDHARAHVGELHRAVRSRQDTREVEDGESLQRSGHDRAPRAMRDDVGEQAIGGLGQTAGHLADRDPVEDVGLEDQCVRAAIERCQQVVSRQFARCHRADQRPARLASCGGDQLQPHASSDRVTRGLARAGVEPGAKDVVRCDPRIHQDVGERGGLGRGVPAVHVERRIGLGDAFRLHPRQRVFERRSGFERRDDVVGRRVDDAFEANDVDRRQRLANEVEDRDAVHDRTFEQEADAGALGRITQVSIGKGHRTLVGRHHVTPGRDRGTDVRGGRFAGLDVERGGLDHDTQVGLRRTEPADHLEGVSAPLAVIDRAAPTRRASQ